VMIVVDLITSLIIDECDYYRYISLYITCKNFPMCIVIGLFNIVYIFDIVNVTHISIYQTLIG
jgi:hypothetical protein